MKPSRIIQNMITLLHFPLYLVIFPTEDARLLLDERFLTDVLELNPGLNKTQLSSLKSALRRIPDKALSDLFQDTALTPQELKAFLQCFAERLDSKLTP